MEMRKQLLINQQAGDSHQFLAPIQTGKNDSSLLQPNTPDILGSNIDHMKDILTNNSGLQPPSSIAYFRNLGESPGISPAPLFNPSPLNIRNPKK